MCKDGLSNIFSSFTCLYFCFVLTYESYTVGPERLSVKDNTVCCGPSLDTDEVLDNKKGVFLTSQNIDLKMNDRKRFVEKSMKKSHNVFLEDCLGSGKVYSVGKNLSVFKDEIFQIVNSNIKKVFLLSKDESSLEPFRSFFPSHFQKISYEKFLNLSFTHNDVVVLSERDWFFRKKDLAFKKKIDSKFSPLFLIFEDGSQRANTYLNFKQKTLNKKIAALSKFHLSQVERTPFDSIIEKMAYFAMKKRPDSIAVPVEDYSVRKDFSTDDSEDLSFYKSIDAYQITKDDHVLIASPHPDDAEIGCGGLLQYLQEKSVPTTVAVATSGHRSIIYKKSVEKGSFYSKKLLQSLNARPGELLEQIDIKMQIRKEESQNALLSLHENVNIEFLELPFYEKSGYEISQDDLDILKKKLNRLKKYKRLFVFTPHPSDMHKAHQKTTEIFTQVLRDFLPGSSKYLVYYYTPWSGGWNIYYYNSTKGFEFSALVGSELLGTHGKRSLNFKTLGGNLAQRYLFTKTDDFSL